MWRPAPHPHTECSPSRLPFRSQRAPTVTPCRNRSEKIDIRMLTHRISRAPSPPPRSRHRCLAGAVLHCSLVSVRGSHPLTGPTATHSPCDPSSSAPLHMCFRPTMKCVYASWGRPWRVGQGRRRREGMSRCFWRADIDTAYVPRSNTPPSPCQYRP